MNGSTLGPTLYTFFTDHLQTMKGLRPASVRSYRDALRLFLNFLASQAHRKISRLTTDDLTFDAVLSFLKYLEVDRKNHVRTRNHRLTVLHEFFEFLASREPEMLRIAERVAAIPTKRVPPPETGFLERDDIDVLFARLPKAGKRASRDQALLLFLYNTGARVQEGAGLRGQDPAFGPPPRVRLHGKGGKWRTCPLWDETTRQLQVLVQQQAPDAPVFTSRQGRPMTRFGIYKLVRRKSQVLDLGRRVGPHVFRHTTAVHLLEAGVEVNVIRGWLGPVSLDTTNRYAEINIRAKEAALRACDPPRPNGGFPAKPVWRNDDALLSWLESL